MQNGNKYKKRRMFMEYLIEPMHVSGNNASEGACFVDICGCKDKNECTCQGVDDPPCKIDVCNCEGGREGCGAGGRSPESRSLPPVV